MAGLSDADLLSIQGLGTTMLAEFRAVVPPPPVPPLPPVPATIACPHCHGTGRVVLPAEA